MQTAFTTWFPAPLSSSHTRRKKKNKSPTSVCKSEFINFQILSYSLSQGKLIDGGAPRHDNLVWYRARRKLEHTFQTEAVLRPKPFVLLPTSFLSFCPVFGVENSARDWRVVALSLQKTKHPTLQRSSPSLTNVWQTVIQRAASLQLDFCLDSSFITVCSGL